MRSGSSPQIIIDVRYSRTEIFKLKLNKMSEIQNKIDDRHIIVPTNKQWQGFPMEMSTSGFVNRSQNICQNTQYFSKPFMATAQIDRRPTVEL